VSGLEVQGKASTGAFGGIFGTLLYYGLGGGSLAGGITRVRRSIQEPDMWHKRPSTVGYPGLHLQAVFGMQENCR
jgi:hypothetical protein